MKRIEAYAFTSHLTLPEMLGRLNALGRHEWILGDSAWYGDYLKVWTYRGGGERVRLRIYEFAEDDPPFVLEMIFESAAPDAETAWRDCHAHVWDAVLPALGADTITPTDSVD